MPKMTIIDMVQDILSDMDSDEVNSINDTLEALQVAQILKTTYYEILNQRDWDHVNKLFQLTASGDGSKPTHMTIENDIVKVHWIKYNKRSTTDTRDWWSEVEYKAPTDFVALLNDRDSSSSDITTVYEDSVPLFIFNERTPTYYTSFDDESLIFDAYDSAVETTLQTSKTQCFGAIEPAWSMVDTFTPDLPSKAFPFYLAESKSVAFNSLKQFPNAKEEQRSRRQRYRISREKRRNEGQTIIYPDYGRK